MVLNHHPHSHVVQEIHLEEALRHVDMSHAPIPKRKQAKVDHFTKGAEDGPEVSKQLLADAAARAGGLAAGVLRGPHCENEDVSPALVAAVATWLVLTDPLQVTRHGLQLRSLWRTPTAAVSHRQVMAYSCDPYREPLLKLYTAAVC